MDKKKSPGCGALIVLVVILFIFYKIFSDDDAKETPASSSPNQTEVYITAKDYVKAELKAPATADFGDHYTYIDNKDSTYDLAGTVDSQNSFGANLRATWRVSLRWRGGDWTDNRNWVLEEIVVR